MSLDDALYVLSITAVLALVDLTFAVLAGALSVRRLHRLDVLFALPALGLLSLGGVVWQPHEFLALRPLKRAEIEAVALANGQWEFIHRPMGTHESDRLTVPQDIAVHLFVRSDTERRQLYIPALRVRVEVDPGETASVWFRAEEPTTESSPLALHDRYRYRVYGDTGPLSVHVLGLEDYWAYHETGCSGPDCSAATNPMACWGEMLTVEMGCRGCHELEGPGMGPPLRGMWGSTTTLTDGRTALVDEAHLRRALHEPEADIAVGYGRATMPTYVPTENRLLAIAMYLESLAVPDPPFDKRSLNYP